MIPEHCEARDCTEPVDCAIRTAAPSSKQGLVHTVYQFPEDAPNSAAFYCVRHGMHIAEQLVRLSNVDGADQ